MTAKAFQKLLTLAFYIFAFTVSFFGCTATQKQTALCYSGCVLESVVKCAQRCSKPTTPTLSIQPGLLNQAYQLQQKEIKASGKKEEKKTDKAGCPPVPK